MKHVKSLDGLRGSAVLIVMFAHFNGLFGITNGNLGVDIFFVLSGFLITSILLAEIEDTGTIALGRFYMRRALRLVPALVVTVIVFGGLDLMLGIWPASVVLMSGAATLLQYPSNWIRALELWNMMQFGHTWSLAIEEQFYLLWPLALLALVRFVRSRAGIAGLVLITIAALQINRALSTEPYIWISAATHMRVDAIFVGCLAALGIDYLRSDEARKIVGVLAVFALAAILAVILARRDYLVWQQPIICVATAILILTCTLNERGALQTAMSAPWLSYTGRISYGLYLFHYPMWHMTVHKFLGGVVPTDVKQLIGLFILMPLSFLMAWASYKYIEEPALRLKSRFRPKPHLPTQPVFPVPVSLT